MGVFIHHILIAKLACSAQCYQVIIVCMDHFGLCSQQQNHHILISKLACRTQCYQVIIVVMDHFGVSSQQQNHSDSHARLQHTVLSGHHRLHGSLCPLQPTAEPPHSDSHARLKHTVLSGHHRLHCSLRSLQLRSKRRRSKFGGRVGKNLNQVILSIALQTKMRSCKLNDDRLN